MVNHSMYMGVAEIFIDCNIGVARGAALLEEKAV